MTELGDAELSEQGSFTLGHKTPHAARLAAQLYAKPTVRQRISAANAGICRWEQNECEVEIEGGVASQSTTKEQS